MMPYASRTDLDDVFGSVNINKWADLENQQDSALITARVDRALVYADAVIDDTLRGGLYDLPVVDKSAATPTLIIDVATKVAAVWLYELRGSTDFDPKTGEITHKLAIHKKQSGDMLRKIKAGMITLDATLKGSISPKVVTDVS